MLRSGVWTPAPHRSFTKNSSARHTSAIGWCQPGQPRLGLKAGAAKDRFSLMGVEAEISFVRGADGKIEALILHQGGVEQRAKRLPPGEVPKARAEVALEAAVLAEYPGTYPLSPTFVLTVTVEAGNVFVQATGQAKNRIFAEAKDDFFLKVVDARVSFTRDAGGKGDGFDPAAGWAGDGGDAGGVEKRRIRLNRRCGTSNRRTAEALLFQGQACVKPRYI